MKPLWTLFTLNHIPICIINTSANTILNFIKSCSFSQFIFCLNILSLFNIHLSSCLYSILNIWFIRFIRIFINIIFLMDNSWTIFDISFIYFLYFFIDLFYFDDFNRFLYRFLSFVFCFFGLFPFIVWRWFFIIWFLNLHFNLFWRRN